MKPSFALNFTDDSIQLLHRTGKGWVPVGETPFAAPDLDDALDYMRKTALGLEPAGFSTQLVIPNSQIKYLEVEAPGPDDEARRAQILIALEGKTPYAAEDLVFDWSGKGKKLRVAVLARETLQEAEGFASTHKFNPLGFTAIPASGDFSGGPWFGETSQASSLLADGETVEHDAGAIVIFSRDLPRDVATPEPESDPQPQLDLAPEPPTPAINDAPPQDNNLAADPVADPAEDDSALLAALAEDTPAVSTQADIAPTEHKPKDPRPTDPAPAIDDMAPAPLAAASAPAVAHAPDLPVMAAASKPAAGAADVTAKDDLAGDEAPFTHVSDNQAFPEDDEGPDSAPDAPAPKASPVGSIVDPGLDDDIPPAPPSSAMVAFASRRAVDAQGRAPTLGAASRPDPAALARAAKGKPIEDLPPMPRPPQAPGRPAATRPASDTAGGLRAGVGRSLGSLVSSPALGGTRKAKVKPGPLPPPPAKPLVPSDPTADEAAKSLTRPGGTFGKAPVKPVKSRGVLFLSLVAVLLLCLALVAAWSSYYLANRTADPATTSVAAADPASDPSPDTSTPAVEDEMFADGEADLIDPNADPAATADSQTGPDTALVEDLPGTQPLPDNQDEVFVSTSDGAPPALDALSLPPPEATSDALPTPQMPPPPFGTVYAFDENGLLIPTPDGILSPEGVLLIAGKPPVVPPVRSEAAAAAALAAAAAPATETTPTVEALAIGETAPSAAPDAGPDTAPETAQTEEPAVQPAVQPNPDLADRRPKPRPAGLAPNPLAPNSDDAALTVEPGTVVTSLRPRSRPQAVLAAGDRARQETETASLAAAAATPTAVPDETEAQLAAAAAAEAANPSVLAISRRPAARPKDFNRAVEAAVAAAIRAPTPKPEPDPEPAPKKAAKAPAPDLKPDEKAEVDEPEVAAGKAPKVPTKASVAKQATYANAINLSKINLIGVYGTPSKRYALIRQANGKYKKVYVGDKIDGGKVQAITDGEVRYKKGSRLISLKMPKG